MGLGRNVNVSNVFTLVFNNMTWTTLSFFAHKWCKSWFYIDLIDWALKNIYGGEIQDGRQIKIALTHSKILKILETI
jgi:hypothetical protein